MAEDMTGADLLSGGFAEPAIQAAYGFRAILQAMARPGRIYEIGGARPPAPLSPAAGAVLLTLCDGDTPVYLAGEADHDAVRSWLAFHTGAPLAGPTDCQFALGTWAALAPISAYPVGTPAYPDRSATLIVDQADLSPSGARLTGPGIQREAALSLPEITAFQRNHAQFPLGLDFMLTCGSRLAALPRSTRVAPDDSATSAQEGVS